MFEVSLEIRENVRGDKDSGFEVVPRQKGVFKLRSNVEKKVVVSVQQVSRNSCRLGVERCFGMLVSPGRNVRHADMQVCLKGFSVRITVALIRLIQPDLSH